MISVVVFTRDLRVNDNPALFTAVSTSAAVVPLFVLDDELLGPRAAGHASRLRFLLESLRALDASLRERGGALVVRRGPWAESVAEVCRAAGAGVIHLAADVSGYANNRLAQLEAISGRLTVMTHPGITVVPPEALRPAGGLAYRVFTPYYLRWLDAPRRLLRPAPPRITLPEGVTPGRVPELAEIAVPASSDAWLSGGEGAGHRRLRLWMGSGLASYDLARDDLAADRTSRLSPYLHLGCLSPLEVEAELRTGPGGAAVVRQLAWRDFFCQLLAAYPAAAHADFRDQRDDWADDPDALGAWQEGQTGYPVVDAGMRQLAAEGFMHGRARMITASFLTKDLYVDWRLGAAHFRQRLVDGDIACNQLNWQWVAGTGSDPRRYRVFNPVRQGLKYDPLGRYIRRWVPELAHLPANRIHEPAASERRAAGYPPPLVDHREAAAAYRARPRLNGARRP